MMLERGEDKHLSILMTYTDTLLQSDTPIDFDAFLKAYDVELHSPLGRLMQLATYLHQMLPNVKPSPEFVESLYEELVGSLEEDNGDWFSQLHFERQLEKQLERWRHLPRPMQLMAGLTITAGFFWIAARVRREGILTEESTENVENIENIEKSA